MQSEEQVKIKMDKWLKDNVLQELEFDSAVNANLIGVAVEDGAVSLTGTINDYSQRYAAVKAVKRIAGVKSIADDINVVLSPAHRQDDSEIAKHISHVFTYNISIPEDAIKANITRGHVTLTGIAESEKQRRNIEKQVSHVAGVTAIENLIELQPKLVPEDVQMQISAALQRNAELEADHIDVEVDGHKVILTGRVKAFYERELAQLAAWRAEGVTEVVDRIKVGN